MFCIKHIVKEKEVLSRDRLESRSVEPHEKLANLRSRRIIGLSVLLCWAGMRNGKGDDVAQIALLAHRQQRRKDPNFGNHRRAS